MILQGYHYIRFSKDKSPESLIGTSIQINNQIMKKGYSKADDTCYG